MVSEGACLYCKKPSAGSLCASCLSFMNKRAELEKQVEMMGIARASVQNGMTIQAMLSILDRPHPGEARPY